MRSTFTFCKIVQLKGERNKCFGLFHVLVTMVFSGETFVNCEGN